MTKLLLRLLRILYVFSRLFVLLGKIDIYPIDMLNHASTRLSIALFIGIHKIYIRHKGCVNSVTVHEF